MCVIVTRWVVAHAHLDLLLLDCTVTSCVVDDEQSLDVLSSDVLSGHHDHQIMFDSVTPALKELLTMAATSMFTFMCDVYLDDVATALRQVAVFEAKHALVESGRRVVRRQQTLCLRLLNQVFRCYVCHLTIINTICNKHNVSLIKPAAASSMHVTSVYVV